MVYANKLVIKYLLVFYYLVFWKSYLKKIYSRFYISNLILLKAHYCLSQKQSQEIIIKPFFY